MSPGCSTRRAPPPARLFTGAGWRTDRDEFGVAVVHDGALTLHPLPVDFPMQATGADGARRDVRIATAIDGRLVLVISSPFADRSGWGTRNYLLGFDPRDGRLALVLTVGGEHDEDDVQREALYVQSAPASSTNDPAT